MTECHKYLRKVRYGRYGDGHLSQIYFGPLKLADKWAPEAGIQLNSELKCSWIYAYDCCRVCGANLLSEKELESLTGLLRIGGEQAVINLLESKGFVCR